MAAGVRSVVETANVPAFITNRERTVPGDSGVQVKSNTVVFLKATQTIGLDDVITFDSVTYPVREIRKARNFAGVHHLEVLLGES